MNCHEVDYEIIGDDMQIVEVELDPGEKVVAEAGSMNYMEDGITYEAKMGDGSNPNEGMMGKLLSVGKRALTGESIFMTHFVNSSTGKKRVSFAAPYPGKIIAVDMKEVGGELTCQKDAFLAAALGTEISIAFNKRLGTGFFGGEGFILQKLRGDGMAFIHAGGTVIRKKLQGEILRVDRLYCCFHHRDRLFDREGGKLEIDVFRRGGIFPGHPARPRRYLASEPALFPPGRPGDRQRAQIGRIAERRGLGAGWAGRPVRGQVDDKPGP